MRALSIRISLAAISAVFVCTGMTAAAETLWSSPPASFNCPVDLTIQPSSLNGLMMISPQARYLRVTLRKMQQQTIDSASVTVHGRKNTGAIPATTQPADEISKTYHLARNPDLKASLSANLPLPDTMGGVVSVTVESIHFADGHTWSASQNGACIAVPSPHSSFSFQ